MGIVKNIALLLVIILSSCGNPKQGAQMGMQGAGQCRTREACLNDPNCLCWCSQKCGFRKKTAADRPIYIENDSRGKNCYCKQWDIDKYDDNCGSGNNMMQNDNSQ